MKFYEVRCDKCLKIKRDFITSDEFDKFKIEILSKPHKECGGKIIIREIKSDNLEKLFWK